MMERLDGDCMQAIAECLDADSLLPASLSCKAILSAVKASDRSPFSSRVKAFAARRELAAFAAGAGCSLARLQEAATEVGCTEVILMVEEMGLHAKDKQLCWRAAEHGRLECLRLLRRLGSAWDEMTAWQSARNGHLHVLQWARSQDPPCPWDEWCIAYAAYGGHLNIVQWARSQVPPCPWSSSSMRAAERGGHAATLEWLQENGCPA